MDRKNIYQQTFSNKQQKYCFISINVPNNIVEDCSLLLFIENISRFTQTL